MSLILGIAAWFVPVTVTALGTSTPEHVVLSWTENPALTQSITWRTKVEVTGTVAEWTEMTGADADSADRTWAGPWEGRTEGTSFVLATDLGEMRIHEVTLRDLRPDTTYRYRVGDGTDDGWSEAYRFHTAPGDDQAMPFRFLFMTDTQAVPNAGAVNGYGIWGELLHKGLSTWPDARFVLLSGDIVDYGDRQLHWEKWFEAAGTFLPGVNLVPTVGNHDAIRDGERLFRAHFQLPLNGPAGHEELVYSFDYGNVHMAVLNTEADLAEQAAWLRDDMAASDQMWKIVAFHRSPYHTHPERNSSYIREAWTPMFDEAGVDLVLSGHDHAYMRSWPLYAGEKVSEGKGTTYIVGGSAGPKFYPVGDYPWIRVVFDEDVSLFSGVMVDGHRLSLQAVTRDGRTIDRFTLVKPPEPGGFTDVFPSAWYYAPVHALADHGVVSGYPDGSYEPGRSVTRAEFASLMVRALGLTADGHGGAGTKIFGNDAAFRDVHPEDWYYAAVQSVFAAGLMEGVGGGRFAPDQALTRQELAVLLVKSAAWLRTGTASSASPDPGNNTDFADDTRIADWARPYVAQAATDGLLSGRDGNMFAPHEATTRAEAASVLQRLMVIP